MKLLPMLVLAIAAVVAASPAPNPAEQRKKPPKNCAGFGDPCSKAICCGGYKCMDGGKELVCLPADSP
ncbi:hypothetical protein GX51_07184 [Blastomyces parvus]|uniref:Uncharacterized protein n=1 Tax=Blastomyces parvus TaxID=2060905 RepID=A0A2B7WMI5_9EURO|nr:hypothetical protein GX51_07184 [Blastomyces parvus]